jgi:D-glycero-D-manno-heptose 1,7-bisphosphate phosphatase
MTKALFLDRDGVINKEINYLYKIEDFELVDGILELCKYYQDNDYLIIVITNQAGIARGKYTKKDFEILTKWMINLFKMNNITISEVYHCPHHPEFTGVCPCRKPNIGMILKAKEKYNIDLSNSILIGDKESDIDAGLNANIGLNILFSKDIISSKAKQIVKKLNDIKRN